MSRRSSPCPLLLPLVLLSSLPALGEAGPTTIGTPIAIVGVHVVPMDRERILADQTVLIEGDRIVSVGPASDAELPEGTREIDGRGSFLMPSLADMHVHLTAEELLPLYLANGITTVVNMNGSPEVLELARRIEADELPGPRIFTTGPLVAGEEVRWKNRVIVRTPDEARSVVDDQVAVGYDFVKVYEGLRPEVYAALLERCRERGIRAIGHVPDAVDPEVFFSGQAAAHHVGSLAWGFFWPDLAPDAVAPLASRFAASGVAFCPTLSLYVTMARQVTDLEGLLARPEMRYVPAGTRRWWVAAVPEVDESRRLFHYFGNRVVATMKRAGATLLVGTDHPNPFVVPGFSIHDELAALVAAGLSPYEAFEGATRQAGEFLDLEVGTVTPGSRADLLLLADNPLAGVESARRPLGVMVRGHWYPRPELDQLLQRVEAWVQQSE